MKRAASKSDLFSQLSRMLTKIWLGREDSNLRMAESKSAALPLGYAPTGNRITYRDRSLKGIA